MIKFQKWQTALRYESYCNKHRHQNMQYTHYVIRLFVSKSGIVNSQKYVTVLRRFLTFSKPSKTLV